MDYDLTIIGGGPGGYVAAIRAAQLGMKVAVIEEREMGGTCLNRGCIPTKCLLHAADLYQSIRHCHDFGILAETAGFDFAQIMARKEAVVRQLRSGVESLVKKHGGAILPGHGSLVDRQTIQLTGVRSAAGSPGPAPDRIRTGQIILATGSRPARPPIPGSDGDRILDSDAVLTLPECPERVIIIGGGVIGVEFATLFNQLGKSVVLIEMLDQLLPGADAEIAAALRQSLTQRGVAIHTGAKVLSLQSLPDQTAVCRFETQGQTREAAADRIILATGRRPNTEHLGLEQIGLPTNRGAIAVDDRMATAIPGIYAIGDVNGRIQLAHAASAQGLVAAANAAGGRQTFQSSRIPACVYTSPEIAWVGLTEAAARQQGRAVQIGRFPVRANGRSLIMGEREGFAKLIADQKTGEILGAHLMGPRATDLIMEMGLAMNLESTVEEVAAAVHPHPTVSEILMEAAHDVAGLGLHQF